MSDLSGLNGIHVVASKADRKKFLDFPYQHYAGNKYYVPPLRIEQKKLLDQEKNPFYRHADIQLFYAEKNGKVVGRIAAIENRAYNNYHNSKTGFFGFFECIDEPSVARLLFRVAKDWLKTRGLNDILGPSNPGMMDIIGVLVEGFDKYPAIMMPYNKPYYDRLIKSCGFEKAMDMYSYFVIDEKVNMERLDRGKKLIEQRYPTFHLRSVNMKEVEREGKAIREIFNKAWADNWGFVPITKEEFDALIGDLKMIVDPDFAFIVEVEGKPVGFSIALPDWNQALKYVKNGRLFPTGIFKLLYHKKDINSYRTALMGVLPEYRRTGFDAMMHRQSTINCLKSEKYIGTEIGWILESNTNMVRVAESVPGTREKTYRMYKTSV